MLMVVAGRVTSCKLTGAGCRHHPWLSSLSFSGVPMVKWQCVHRLVLQCSGSGTLTLKVLVCVNWILTLALLGLLQNMHFGSCADGHYILVIKIFFLDFPTHLQLDKGSFHVIKSICTLLLLLAPRHLRLESVEQAQRIFLTFSSGRFVLSTLPFISPLFTESIKENQWVCPFLGR